MLAVHKSEKEETAKGENVVSIDVLEINFVETTSKTKTRREKKLK